MSVFRQQNQLIFPRATYELLFFLIIHRGGLGKISRMLLKFGIRPIHHHHHKNPTVVELDQGRPGPGIPGIRMVPCKCSLSGIGQTGWTIAKHCKEHDRCIQITLVWFNAVFCRGTSCFSQLPVLSKSEAFGD